MSRRPLLVWVVWTAARLFAIATVALPKGVDVSTDLGTFVGWADTIASGQPIAGDSWQYPPGVALLLALVSVTGHSLLALLVVIVGSDAILMARLARTQGAMLWALAGVLIGPMMLTRLDTLVTLVAVLGLAADRATRSGLLLGLGASLKAWPAFLPLAGRGRIGLRAATAAGAYAGVALTAGMILDTPSFVGNQHVLGGWVGLAVQTARLLLLVGALALGVQALRREAEGANSGPAEARLARTPA